MKLNRLISTLIIALTLYIPGCFGALPQRALSSQDEAAIRGTIQTIQYLWVQFDTTQIPTEKQRLAQEIQNLVKHIGKFHQINSQATQTILNQSNFDVHYILSEVNKYIPGFQAPDQRTSHIQQAAPQGTSMQDQLAMNIRMLIDQTRAAYEQTSFSTVSPEPVLARKARYDGARSILKKNLILYAQQHQITLTQAEKAFGITDNEIEKWFIKKGPTAHQIQQQPFYQPIRLPSQTFQQMQYQQLPMPQTPAYTPTQQFTTTTQTRQSYQPQQQMVRYSQALPISSQVTAAELPRLISEIKKAYPLYAYQGSKNKDYWHPMALKVRDFVRAQLQERNPGLVPNLLKDPGSMDKDDFTNIINGILQPFGITAKDLYQDWLGGGSQDEEYWTIMRASVEQES